MSRWIAAFCVVALVGAGVAIVQVPSSAGDSWLVILWAAWVVAVVWVLTRPSFSVLFAAIMAAMFLFVILPATEAQLFGLTIIAGNDYKDGVVRGLQIAALAQCGMLAGAVAARTFWPVPRFVRVFPQLSPAPLGRAVRWSVLVGVLAVLAFSMLGGASLRSFFVYTTAGGYGEFAREATGNLGYLTALQGTAGLALVLLPLPLRLGGSAASRRSALFFAALATLVLLGGGERGRFFVPVFAAGLIWLKTSKRRRPPRRVAAVGLLTLLVLGGLVGTARGAAASRHVSVGTVIAQPFGSGNDLFLPLAGLAETVPGQLPYLHGTSYLEAAVFLVPRGLWKGKPQGAIADVTTTIDPGNSGIAFPEFGEMYANFGMPGVVLGSLLFGALIELLARRFSRSTSVGETVFAAVCGAILLDVFTRGAVAPMLTSFAGLFAATALICRRRSRVLAAPPQALRSSRSSRSSRPGGPEPTRRRAASP
jgi:oligosaccharide repeat unit polymerase